MMVQTTDIENYRNNSDYVIEEFRVHASARLIEIRSDSRLTELT